MAITFEQLEHRNYWDGRSIRVGIARQRYLDQLDPFLGNHLVKVLILYFFRHIISRVTVKL